MAEHQIVDTLSMPPPPPRLRVPRKKLVELDEDTYSANLEAIIERDFFPDVPKMRSALEWLHAVKSGNPAQIRQAQINIAHRRAGIKTPGTPHMHGGGGGATPALGKTPMTRLGTENWATPGTNPMRTPIMTPLVRDDGSMTPPVHGATGGAAGTSIVSGVVAEPRAPSMGLDTFLAKYTSEDNGSFHRIVEDQNKKKRIKYAHHLDDKDAQQARSLLDVPHASDGYGSSGQKPMTLKMCKHEALSNIYYNPSSTRELAFTDRELASQVQGPGKKVLLRNTRISASSAAASHEPDEVAMAVASAAAESAAMSGNSALVAAAARDAYDRLATPSFTPGAGGESPFMTWGDIGSTPLRLDIDDSGFGGGHSSGSLSFNVQDLGGREKVLHQIAHKSGLLKGRGMGGGSGAVARSPSPALAVLRQHTRTPGVPLSPAARALAQKLGKGGTMPGASTVSVPLSGQRDHSLRASYSKSASLSRGGSTPGGGGSSAGRPLSSTPGILARSNRGAAGTPNLTHVGASEVHAVSKAKSSTAPHAVVVPVVVPGGDITDNLLNL